MSSFLVRSLVLSIGLTVILNLILRSRGVRAWLAERLESITRPDQARHAGVRVFFPWKAMIVVSIVLTVVLNIVIRL